MPLVLGRVSVESERRFAADPEPLYRLQRPAEPRWVHLSVAELLTADPEATGEPLLGVYLPRYSRQ